MERLTRTETSQKIIYTLGHTRWMFDKRDHSRLQDVLDWLFEYQALGTVEELSALVKARDEGRVVVLPCEPYAAYYQWPKTEKYPSVSRFEGVYINEDGEVIYHTSWRDFKAEDIGKTVFLTRTEAEAALGGGGDG